MASIIIAAEAGQASLYRESVPDNSAYALNRKADWDRNDFSSLFERHLLGGNGNAPRNYEAASPSIKISAGNESVDAGLQADGDVATGNVIESGGSMHGIGSLPEQTSGAVVVSSEPAGVGLAETVPDDQWSLAESASQQETVSYSCATSDNEASVAAPRVTTRLDGDAVDVWIRDAVTSNTNAPALLNDIRAQLSWRGLVLASLTINGRSVMSPNGRYTAPDPTNSGREQNHGR